MRMQANHRPIPGAVATVGVDERMRFLRRTYAHLLGALLAFVAVIWGIQQTEFARDFTLWAWSGQGYNWLLVVGGFMLISWLADKWSHSDTSTTTQYIGLAVYVVGEAILFTPLIHIAAFYSDPSVLPNAALLTAFLFTGLTGTVFIMRKDFSFLRGILAIGGFAAMGLIVCGILFGFELGLWFAVAMIVYSAGVVLYQTSQVMAHYRPTQHVGAALGLFAAVALMLYYVIIMFLNLSRD